MRTNLIRHTYIDDQNECINENAFFQIFSADYDENSVQMGVKASTAKNYEKRIIEFFNFMSEQYEGFHLDWFTDYRWHSLLFRISIVINLLYGIEVYLILQKLWLKICHHYELVNES